MLEVFNDVLCLMGSEWCVVWVSWKKSFASDDSSVVAVWGEVTDARKLVNE